MSRLHSGAHSKSVGRDCIKRAKQKHGLGWAYLSDEQRKGAIALEVVSVTMSCLNMLDDKSTTAEHLRTVTAAALWEEA